jgi:hypothetical protein
MALKPNEFTFHRTELRALQARCKGNNEQFLSQLAVLVGNLTKERDTLKQQMEEQE